MRAVIAALALLCAFSAQAEEKTLTIVPATERADGSPLPAGEIASHRIQCQVNGGPFDELETLLMPTLEKSYDFPRGTNQCRAWTIDTDGQVSGEATLSNPFTVTPAPPLAPASVEIR